MSNKSGFDLQFQARSSAELLKKYRVKVENSKTCNTQTKGSCSKQELKKSFTSKQTGNNGNAIQIPRHIQMQNIKQDQRKQSLTIGIANNDGKMQLMTTIGNQDQVTMDEQQTSKKKKITPKFPPMSLIGNQDQVTMKEQHASKKKRITPNFLPMSLIGNQDQVTMEEQQASKKNKITPNFPPMSLDDFLNKNKKQVEEDPEDLEELEDENGEENDKEGEVEGDINYQGEVNETNDSTTKGAASKGKRGKTKCLKVHARPLEDRQEIILNKLGQPIGPDQKTIVEFSNFLGTMARSADFCPLTYTNWKAIPNKELMWAYVNQKYIIPEKGKKFVLAIINDAWRRHKWLIKKNHFSKYKTFREQLKNRPKDVPEAHFKELVDYWRLEAIQRATNENQEPPNQAEMFFETRQSKKGKQLDQETTDAITKLKDLMESSGQPPKEAFQTVFGKEKPRRVRCYARTTTPTFLKRKEEIEEIEKKHANEVKHLNDKVEEMETKHKQEMSAMDKKFQLLLKTVINQNNSGLNVEALTALLTTPGDANSVPRSSTSTHTPNNYEPNIGLADDNMLDMEDEDEYLDS